MTEKRESITTPEFRCSYPALFQPKYNKLNEKEEYGVVALFAPGTDLSALKADAIAAATGKFGERSKWPRNMRTPFRDQADREKDGVLPPGHEAGGVYLNLKSLEKPGVVDQGLQAIIEPRKIYGGCWLRAKVRAFAYSKGGNNGVSFGLQHVQLVRDDEPFGAPRIPPEKAFTAIRGAKGSSSEGSDAGASDLFGGGM